VVYTDVEYVLAGGLMSLGSGHYEGYYGAAKYVDKILHGANPAELPIAGPTQFTFSVSRTALAKLDCRCRRTLRGASTNGSIERRNGWPPVTSNGLNQCFATTTSLSQLNL
jgi:ABC-type uncharacterized transport system substrate-binding protein